MIGKVIASKYGVYTILCDNITYNVIGRGILKFQSKEVLVGDDVEFDKDAGIISSIKERKNLLIRPKISNVDQLIIVMSLKEPEFSFQLIYKFLTYANLNEIHAKVILTKSDLFDDKELLERIKVEFSQCLVDFFIVGKDDEKMLSSIKEMLTNKVSVLMGQTGVGKSTLINLLDASFNRKVREISTVLNRGKHTTKEVVLLSMCDGLVADTPGFSSLDLLLTKEQLAQYYPPFKRNFTKCFYTNCLHKSENKCMIKTMLKDGNITDNCYNIYLKLIDDIDNERK